MQAWEADRPRFEAFSTLRIWTQYYGRIPGHKYAFHVRARNAGKWWAEADWPGLGGIREQQFASEPGGRPDTAVRDLVVAITSAQRLNADKKAGGAFLINEFGNVLVPSRDASRVRWIGNWHGPIYVTDPTTGVATSLYDDDGLAAGDRWSRPYVGVSYLGQYFRHDALVMGRSADEVVALRDVCDAGVLELLRRVRWESDFHFIVTYGGLVLTRVPSHTGRAPTETVYAGRIDLSQWRMLEALPRDA